MNNGVDHNNRVQRMYLPPAKNSPVVNCFAILILATAIICGLATLGCFAAMIYYSRR